MTSYFPTSKVLNLKIIYLKILITYKGRRDADHKTFFDHLTVIKEYIVIANKHCRIKLFKSFIKYIDMFIRRHFHFGLSPLSKTLFRLFLSRLTFSDQC